MILTTVKLKSLIGIVINITKYILHIFNRIIMSCNPIAIQFNK